MKIDNSKESAVMSGSWSKPGSGFYNALIKENNALELIEEAYLIHGKIATKWHPTPLSKSGCKYPHHTIRNGKLVVSAPGVKAAYSRAKQMGIYKGDVKAHLDKHMRELGFLNRDGVHYEDVMEENFRYIESVIDNALGTNLVEMEESLENFNESTEPITETIEELEEWIEAFVHDKDFRESVEVFDEAKLQYDFRYAYDVETGHKLKIVYELDNIDVKYAGHAYNSGDVGIFPKLSKNQDANKEVMSNIASKGNIDHRSKGQKVKKIIDMVTGKSLEKATVISYLASGTTDNAPMIITPYEIQQRLRSPFSNKAEIKKDETDNNLSFKSTMLLKGKNVGARTSEAENVLKTARGAKAHDFATSYTRNGKSIPYYLHPSKNDIKGYLKGYIEFWADTYRNEYGSAKGSIELSNLINDWNTGKLSERPEWRNAKGTKITINLINELIKENIDNRNLNRISILLSTKTKLVNSTFHEDVDNLYCALVVGTEILNDIHYLKETLNSTPNLFIRYRQELYNIDIVKETAMVLNRIQYNAIPMNESGTVSLLYIDYGELPAMNISHNDTVTRIATDADALRSLSEATNAFTSFTDEPITGYFTYSGMHHENKLFYNTSHSHGDVYQSSDVDLYIDYSRMYENGKPDLLIGGYLPTIDIQYLYEHSSDRLMNIIKDRYINGLGLKLSYDSNGFLIDVLPEICESYNLIQSSYGTLYHDPIDDNCITHITESSVTEGYISDPNRNAYSKYRLTIGDQSYEFGFCRDIIFEVTQLGLDIYHQSHSINDSFKMVTNKFRKYIHNKKTPANIEKIFESEGSDILIPGVTTPSELLSYMNTIYYGWIGKNGERYNDADDGNFFKDYALQSPFELIKSRIGVCWDQVEFERKWFSDNKYNFRTYFIVIDDNENKPSHTFLMYQDKNKVYWFENSWYSQRGIHVFNTLSEAMQEIFDKFNDSHHNKSDDVYIYNLPEMPAGIGCEEYYRIATDSDNLLKHISLGNVNESVSEDSDIEKKWFIKSDDGADNCCIKVKGYDKPMRGRSAMITLQLQEDDNWYLLCKKYADDYGMPGGGWNKDETPKHAAIRELQEETLSNVKNVKRMGTLIEYHDTAKDWVKEHVPDKNDWWYGYYSAIFVGIYDGKFKGKVNAEDRESGYTWKKVDHKLMNDLPKEYADAINDYINKGNPFKESVFTEAEEDEKPEEEKDILDEPIEDDTNQQDPPPVEEPTESQEPTSNEEQPAEEDLPKEDDNTPEEQPEQPEETPQEPQQEQQPEQPVPQKTPISRPKQFANQEQDKNGVRRKNLYIEFIRWAKEYNPKNIFGSNFDKDIFNGSYPFVPDEMRYFYRLADPTLCILAGGLTFFPVIQLRKLNAENKHLDQYMIFAATNDDMRVFSNVDKRVYMATEQNGEIVLGKALANTFDTYIQTMIDKGDILNGPREDTTLEYAEDLV